MAGERRHEPAFAPILGTGPSVLAVAAMLAVLLLPLGDSPARQLMLPHVALVPVVFLTLRTPEGLGPVGAFLAGLAIDVLTFGPLGVFAAGYLAVHAVLRLARDGLLVLPRPIRTVVFALAAGFVLGLTWVVLVAGGAPAPRQANLTLAFVALLAVGIAFEAGLSVIDRRAARAGVAGGAIIGPTPSRPFRQPQGRRRKGLRNALAARRT